MRIEEAKQEIVTSDSPDKRGRPKVSPYKKCKGPSNVAISEEQLLELGEKLLDLVIEMKMADTLEAREKFFKNLEVIWQLFFKVLGFPLTPDDLALFYVIWDNYKKVGKKAWMELVGYFSKWADEKIDSFKPSMEIILYLQELLEKRLLEEERRGNKREEEGEQF